MRRIDMTDTAINTDHPVKPWPTTKHYFMTLGYVALFFMSIALLMILLHYANAWLESGEKYNDMSIFVVIARVSLFLLGLVWVQLSTRSITYYLRYERTVGFKKYVLDSLIYINGCLIAYLAVPHLDFVLSSAAMTVLIYMLWFWSTNGCAAKPSKSNQAVVRSLEHKLEESNMTLFSQSTAMRNAKIALDKGNLESAINYLSPYIEE
jgi:hypothetical protein